MNRPGADQSPARAWGPVSHHGSPVHQRQQMAGQRQQTAGQRQQSAGQRQQTAGQLKLDYAPGLDGVRALAVLAVVVYHLGAPWLTGGFIGVDVFFVLSGFLITSLLIREFQLRGSVNVPAFYVRRARRLLPALFVMLATVSLLTTLIAHERLPRLRGDVVAALTYCTNWTQIAWNRSYFAQLQSPSLLQHLWSLAVEEQFYLMWPVILVLCLATHRRSAVFTVAIGVAAVSTLLMAVLFRAGGDPSRVYYGTDTHIAPMLLGAALAAVVTRGTHVRARRWVARLVSDLAAVAGLLVLGYVATTVGSATGALYRGEYLLVWLAACALVFGAASARTGVATVLGLAPLRWIGARSYAIYLWHWPILMLIRARTTHVGAPLVVAELLIIMVAADLSYRFVENPIRRRGFVATLRGYAPARRTCVGIAAALASVLMTFSLSTAGAPAAVEVDHGPQITVSIGATAPAPSTQTPTRATQTPDLRTSHVAPPASAPPPFPRPVRVAFFGDSQGMTLLLNKPAGLEHLITVTDATIEGCGVQLGEIRSSVGFARDLAADCRNWLSIWAERAQAYRPQIAVVELGAWDVFDTTVAGRNLGFGTAEWDEYFIQQLERGIDILLQADAQVALLAVPCYRPIAAGGLPRLPERGDDSRTRHVNTLLQRAAALNPMRVFMIHPPAQFCTDPSIATDTAYRWDGVHFYKPGAALMFQVITPQLLGIPQQPRQ